MRQLFLLTICSILFVAFLGCSNLDFNIETRVTENDDAYRDFAIILSKAVYTEPELRAFIKEEANKQFDKDRKMIDILRENDNEGKMEFVENAIPKLNILVPDWSWVCEDCFSIHKWDTTDPTVVVAYDLPNGNHRIFFDGMEYETLPKGSFLEVPTLVLKSNERMIEDKPTKGISSGFHLIDAAFDNDNTTKSGHEETVIHNVRNAPDVSGWINKMSLNQRVGDCYNAINSVPGAAQRDYIYYNMTASCSSGTLNNWIAESIFRYKLDPSWSCYYEDEDLTFNQITGTTERDYDYLRAFNWSDGHLEMYFFVNAGFPTALCFYDNCPMSEAFSVIKVKETRHYNWLGILTNRVYYISSDCLAPKWVDPSLNLFTWDIKTIPVLYTIQVFEADSGATHTHTQSSSWQFSTDYSINNEVGGSLFGLTIKQSYGINPSLTYSVSNSTSISYTDNDDNLGTIVVQYTNPVVLENQMYGVRLNSYNTGKIDICIVPTSL